MIYMKKDIWKCEKFLNRRFYISGVAPPLLAGSHRADVYVLAGEEDISREKSLPLSLETGLF